MNIVIVTTGHSPFDERIFYKFAISFKKYGHNVSVLSSREEINTESEGITVRGFNGNSFAKENKIDRLYQEIGLIHPSLIICCEPLAIPAAHRYRKETEQAVKIIYDITEYYPHQNTLNQYTGLVRLYQHIKLSFFNAYAANLADYLFIGEENKAKLYNTIAPAVKKTIIGYYPSRKYFNYSAPGYNSKNFTLCYAGSNPGSAGFGRYIKLIKMAAERFPDKIFTARVIGMDAEGGKDKGLENFSNIKAEFTGRTDYKNYSAKFEGTDVCIDLRDQNKIYNRSLPIKVFDYIACGKPFIFSDLDSFKGFNDLREAGLMTDPDDLESAFNRISLYLSNPGKLKKDSLTAFRLFEEKYNWESIEEKMMGIIDSLFTNP